MGIETHFLYLRDPLFLISGSLYLVNRWVMKPWVTSGFLHHHFNDFITIPFWIPILLWLTRQIGVRKHDQPPRGAEIVLPLVLWSLLFEVVLPHTTYFADRMTADFRDIFWYTAGALGASLFWERWYRPT